MKNPWVWLLVFLIVLFWAPTVFFQPYISPGDKGRDLYAFWMASEGQVPGRDFWWQYGPVTPFYFAPFFILGGVNLVSFRIGLGVLYLICALLNFRALRLFVSRPVAFLSSLAYLMLDVQYTFNHIGAIPFLILGIFSLWKFFLTERVRWCYAGTLALAAMAAVKINTGVTSFAAFYFTLLLYRRLPLKHLAILPLLFGGLVFGVYAAVFWGLPLSWVDYCLTLRKVYRAWGGSPWGNLLSFSRYFLFEDPHRLWGAGLFLTLGGLAVIAFKKKGSEKERGLFLPLSGSLVLVLLANLSDFLLIGGFARVDFWSFPVLALLGGLWMEGAGQLFKRPLKIFLWGLGFAGVITLPFNRYVLDSLACFTPERFLDLPRGKVYLGGEASNVKVIQEGAQFLLKNTRPDQFLLAIPYDPLYLFLAERRHAVREMLFLAMVPLHPRQEEEIIRQIEAKEVPFVILANHYRTEGHAAGTFGETHCQKLARYIFDHYQEVKTLGPWEADPNKFHAVKILRRNVLS